MSSNDPNGKKTRPHLNLNPRGGSRSSLGGGRPSLVSRPDRSLANRLTRTSLLEPTAREVGLRPIRWSMLVVIPLTVIGLVFAVREVSRVERVLSAEGSRASRVVTYELRPGGELKMPIEPGTEVFRVVAHAIKKGSLSPTPHEARLLFIAAGDKGTKSDDVRFNVPGTTARVTPEDSGISIGDPVGVNVDVHGIGVGELTITLPSIADADGVVLRVYRREAVRAKDALARPARLGEEGRARLAHQAGELEWDELDEAEQTMLLGARWRRVAALPQAAKMVPTRAIALTPSKASSPKDGEVHDADPALASYELRGDERAAVFAHGKVSVFGRAEGDPDARVIATVRHPDGRVDTLEGKGELKVDVPADYEAGIELTRSTPGILALRATDPTKIESSGHVSVFRATKARPLVVVAGNEPLVLRVSARRPVPRTSTEHFSIVMDATITPAQGPALASATDAPPALAGGQSVMLRATRERSIYERYDGKHIDVAPTNSAVFHLVVPPRGTLTLTPADEPIDISVAELDPAAPPRPVPAYPAESAGPKVTKLGDQDWGGFVGRRPSNVAVFDAATDGRTIVRTPHRFVPVVPPETKAPSFRIKRPDATDVIVRGKRTFDPTTVSFEIDVPEGEALVLPVRLFAYEKMDIVAKVDGNVIERKASGPAVRITTARIMGVEDEVRTVVVLGDDLAPGFHTLTFEPPAGKKAWVHLPWQPKPRLPGAPPPDPHWIEGDLED